MSNRKRVYIAGPLSQGYRNHNVAVAMAATRELVRLGYAPFCPHLSHFVDLTDALGYDNWLDVDLAWVVCADAVLRLPGTSNGADMETARAKECGIPVYGSIDDLILEMPA
jgi:hypothetical protein